MKVNLTKVKDPLIFVSGLAVGSLMTWLLVKEHYKEEAQDKIDSVEEAYKQAREDAEKAAAAKNKPAISVYTKALQDAEKQKEEDDVEDPEDQEELLEIANEALNIVNNDLGFDDEPEDDKESYIYEITPSEFANYVNDRTRMTIIRFSDDVYTDELYNELDPRDYLRGQLKLLDDDTIVNPIDYIRRMSKDEICIRNFDLNLDIDICTEDRTYRDYMST